MDIALEVDHVKPRSKYPELALDLDNTQILCRACNSKKGTAETDYRRIQ
jgi:5-methylcytosine-specific restriction endonuclease McrA